MGQFFDQTGAIISDRETEDNIGTDPATLTIPAPGVGFRIVVTTLYFTMTQNNGVGSSNQVGRMFQGVGAAVVSDRLMISDTIQLTDKFVLPQCFFAGAENAETTIEFVGRDSNFGQTIGASWYIGVV